MFKYKILKKGRKWFQAEKTEGGYKAQIEINELSKNWEVGKEVEFEGKFDKQVSYGHTKVFIYPCTSEEKQEIIEEAKREKEQQEIERWLGYVENKTDRVYYNGVEKLNKMNLNKEQKKRLDKAVEVATINQASSKIFDHVYYIKKSISENNRWYQNGEDTILKNIETLEKYNVDTAEFKETLKNLRKLYETSEQEQIKLDLERYFEISDLSIMKGDEYSIGTIIKNKNGKLGKVVKVWKYYEPDTMSFGYMCDGGWIKNAKCDMQAVTEAEKEAYFAKEKKFLEEEEIEKEKYNKKREMKENVKQLMDYVRKNGTYPEVEKEYIKVDGEVIFDDFNIYGGGCRIILDNKKVWAIRNNGADGDMWSMNNIHTGGAGAIGYNMIIDDTCNKHIKAIKKYFEERKK